jgi:site-specific recombinase XerD
MGRKGKRLEKGIRRHGSGLQAYIRVNGELRTQQFDLDYPRTEIRDWLKQQRDHARPIRRGTLAADVQTYLATIADKRKRLDAKGRMAHWLRTPPAKKPRALITSAEIKTQMARWLHEPQPPKDRPLAVETVNKCLTTLRALYRDLNTNDDDPNPTIRVSKLYVEKKPPRGVPGGYAMVEKILAAMPDRGQAHKGKGNRSKVNKAKLRLALFAYTGWPPAQMMRIDPETDILWTPRVFVRLRPRRKGKGVAERWMPVTPKGVEALRAFVDGEATGRFNTSSVRRAWLRACHQVTKALIEENIARQQRGEPKIPLPVFPSSPYSLRHTFITQTLRQSSNLAGTQYLAGHADPRQTLVYAQAAIPDEADKAIAAASAVAENEQTP